MPYFGNEPGETTKSTVVGAYNYLINGDMRVATRGWRGCNANNNSP